MKLFIYDHCPYCVKARMIFGLKDIPITLVTLLNDDQDTPIGMIGQKMVPILEREDGSYMPESLDIISYIDGNYGKQLLNYSIVNHELASWLQEVKNLVYVLAMPRWAKAPLEEFSTTSAIDTSAVEYFVKKKEAYIGDFAEHLRNSSIYISNLEDKLSMLEGILHSENSVNTVLGLDDIDLFAALRSLSIVKGVKYPEIVSKYRTNLATQSNIPLHDDLAT